ncbi:COX15/CtaA family protein [Horticoccus luteus]|uniref:COX15/CtaA family protein n=1 Tax=Horticoccus luteus TaxID=2862869 RepID=A0A8F9XH74_9BACT|nr:COX15/CtaA family protein [Horticoccus luteus]QYM79987.1 COX15/CtaA family protein [Horticoccus luteus]
MPDSAPEPSLRYRPGLAWFAALGSTWVFVLVTLGAFTTSIGAGMAFADWPLSNGSVNPHGWLHNLHMFAEHSHRLAGMMMGLITIALVVWIARTETRGWLKSLSWWALAIVIFQGILGGTRVLFDAVHVPGFTMSFGQMLRIPHGIVGQVYVCILFAIATSLSRSWIEGTGAKVSRPVRRAGVICCVLLFVQLTVAAIMRHNNAGLAIPFFPYSNAHHGWLPDVWSFPVAIHFTHRALAVVLSLAIIWFSIRIRLDRSTSLVMRFGSSLIVALVAVQIMLGANIIISLREPHITTGHVVVGALLLASTFWLTWLAHRDQIEERDPS